VESFEAEAARGELAGLEICFTHNQVFESDVFGGTSLSKYLLDLVVGLKMLEKYE
jgi:hypothetical protein